jgi:hypothetical protein
VRLQSAQTAQTFSFSTPLFRETSAAATAYPVLADVTGASISGGIGIQHGFGVAIHFDAVNYRSTVGLGVTVPSPYFFNTSAIAGGATATPLERQDRSVDISAVYTVPTLEGHLSVRVFGGPTYFHLTNQMVETIRYTQAAGIFIPINAVTVTGFTQREVSGSSWGFNAGADMSWFFTRHVGVGGGLRFNRGAVTVLEPLTVKNADLKVGHAEFGGGLRLRL